jgi:hypothetical protein
MAKPENRNPLTPDASGHAGLRRFPRHGLQSAVGIYPKREAACADRSIKMNDS